MATTGAPDWLSPQQFSDAPYLSNVTVNTVAGGADILAASISQWLGLAVSMSVLNQRVALDVIYYTDDTQTIQIASRTYVVAVTTVANAQITLPALGPFVVINMRSSTNSAGNVIITVAGTNRIGPAYPAEIETELVSITAGSVGAAAAVTTNFAYHYAGPVHLSIISTGGILTAQLQRVALGGAATVFFAEDVPAARARFFESPIFVPPSDLQLRIVNNTAGAITYNAYVMPDAWRSYS